MYDGNVSIKGYVNGVLVADGTLTGGYGTLVTDDLLFFGIGHGSYRAKGVFDEMRVSTGIHSAGLIATGYNNQSDPDNFYTLSAEMNGLP